MMPEEERRRLKDPATYWNNAGALGYGAAMFGDSLVERHVNGRIWAAAMDIGRSMGLTESDRVLDLGCGDGAFTNQVLARNFAAVDGFDLSHSGVERAQAEAAEAHVRFRCCDITRLDFDMLPRYDGAFLIGILHHVKLATPSLIRTLASAIDRVVVMEPNGNHILRKLLEFTPSYRAAGEDSFRTTQLRDLFEFAGYRCITWRRMNLFPNFTPQPLFRLLRSLEPTIEATPGLRALCTVNMYGFCK